MIIKQAISITFMFLLSVVIALYLIDLFDLRVGRLSQQAVTNAFQGDYLPLMTEHNARMSSIESENKVLKRDIADLESKLRELDTRLTQKTEDLNRFRIQDNNNLTVE